MGDIILKADGTGALLYVTITDASSNVQNLPNASITFSAGAITKSTDPYPIGVGGIYYAHPLFSAIQVKGLLTDTHPACFCIIFTPSDIAALKTATSYTLSITNAGTTKNYTGTIQGGGNITTYSASTSASASIVITDAPVATAITMVLPATGTTGVAFNITGKLTRTDTGVGVAGMSIQLMQYVSGTWSAVSGKTATTAADGSYTISLSESPAGTYQFETTFAGA